MGFGDHVDLHRLLFGMNTPNLNPHPGVLHYVFFCRAVLGHAARTEDGRTELSTGKNLFAEASGQRELPP